MNRYVEFDIISVASTGNVQEGYEPVLTLGCICERLSCA